VMLTTSAYMVIILFRHQRQCKHLHRNIHPRVSPEKRATQTILLLVVFFVVMYWVDIIISSTSILIWKYDPVILTVQKFVMHTYPTITPLMKDVYACECAQMKDECTCECVQMKDECAQMKDECT
ncbi:hypothetical protein STEG23_004921, partial [Scotinomys teguina]